MVKQMKNTILAILCILISSKSIQAERKVPKELGFARLMTGLLANNVLLGGNRIPEGWSDFMLVNYMKKEAIHSAFSLKSINSFALVPHSPVIKENKGIPTEFSGKRLFLISRYKIHTASSDQGRCVILIYPSANESDKIISAAYFIPEITAQLILNQIPGFDPTKQPLAFDDNFLLENKNKFQGNHLDSTIRAIEKDKHAEAISAIPQQSDTVHQKDKDSIQKNLQKIQAAKEDNPLLKDFMTWVVIGVSLILAIISWRFMNRMKTRKNTIDGA